MNILTLLFTALALAAPAPGPIPQDNAQPPTPITHLYMCKDADFTNECTNLHLEISNCQNIQDSFAQQVSSAGPDNGTFCTLYSDFDCHGRALPFTFPGIRKLARYGFDKALSSVRCDFIAGWADHA